MRAVVAVALAGLTGCAASPPVGLDGPCAAVGGRPMLVAQLFFGRDAAGRGEISETEWRAFVDGVVTPRFADGFTVLDAYGQFREAASGRIRREAAKMVLVVAENAPDVPARLQEIRRVYAERFGQEAVGLALVEGCGAF